jgi:hypothetical protein
MSAGLEVRNLSCGYGTRKVLSGLDLPLLPVTWQGTDSR